MANINENEQSSQSQCAMILDWLERGFSINQMQALEKWGCGRLASRVNDLRNRGYNIVTKKLKNEFNGKWYGEYTLIK